VFKRLRRNRHQLEKDAASSSAQTVTQKEAEPQEKQPLCERQDIWCVSTTVVLITRNVVVSEGI
jgi:hypothetical protein